ncbi:MAG: Gfo/Idh/MocA family oxidoreductase [Prolixibacteraceae bacterium]|jgi:UDP-N-acetyl-2-amino-2-deoxyglucuronate dehydrogenase|nr:Gfo/Idh/MocA family oxidoreductase [Prolixibacteraceae bacterium]MBT6005398.1 Gfo/Idh/MocA family oxidoreductase [Prolixibacteraceae bacterium]MBT6766098.1 Gfo/Idh/MocA family oxidoreductase [Prolixibacteraceae bacterium]MBT6996852.1 Gfo/Idh/MocA family oxidoreductase [Prolixibacteraceae bacterium]MBT7395265.1 Gfo/Idh/MocA family oxidoreductase [Prolixibacteraceae bacterium]
MKPHQQTSDSLYNIAILGCGKVAHLHAKAIENLPNSKLAGVWSRTTKTAEDFSAQYKVPFYSDIKELIQQEKIDLVIVCTPHPFHLKPVLEAANAGAHILVEKPLASTLEDSDSIITACKNAGVKLGVISQRRWYEPVKRVKDAIEAGKIGRPVFGTINMLGWRDKDYYDADEWRGTWKMEGGGVLVNQAPHQLDILLWFMGEIDEVYGQWKNLNHPYIEVEDTAVAIVKFKNGGIGNIIVSNSEKPGIYGKVHVHGENGASVGVQTDGGAMFIAGMSNILEPPINDVWSVPGEEKMLAKWVEEDSAHFNSIDPMVYYMERQIEDFLQAIQNNTEPIVTGEDGRRTVELFTAIYRSTRDNKPVKFPLQPENKSDMDGRLKI